MTESLARAFTDRFRLIDCTISSSHCEQLVNIKRRIKKKKFPLTTRQLRQVKKCTGFTQWKINFSEE